jgi:hypothetical protein
MKFQAALAAAILLLAVPMAHGQGKGVDKQSEKVRDTGSNRTDAANGSKQDVGAGRGIDFGKGRTPERELLPNPYRVVARRDVIIKTVAEVMRDRKLIVDDAASKPAEGIIASQPYTFIKGAVVAEPQLSRYAIMPETQAHAWTRGRYTITVEVQAIDGLRSNVSVNAKIEGRTDGATGPEWVTLESNGTAEQEFLGALIEALTGSSPASP